MRLAGLRLCDQTAPDRYNSSWVTGSGDWSLGATRAVTGGALEEPPARTAAGSGGPKSVERHDWTKVCAARDLSQLDPW